MCGSARPARGLVRWSFSPEFVQRLTAAFDWYLRELDVTPEQRELFDEIMRMVGGSLEALEPPELTYEEVLAMCDGDDEKAQINWDVLSEIVSNGGVSTKCHFDHGHRLYHALTNLKKGIRQRFRIRGDPVVEVDMHATYPAIIAAELAPPGERERLIAMLLTGNFYGEMAELLGIGGVDRAELKQAFQRDAVFSFRPQYASIWRAFAREFPGTAQALSLIRDCIGTIVDEHDRRDVNGRRYITKTRWGQRRLSRILSREESAIFFQRALVRLGRRGIDAIPIHDCLMVAKQHAELAKQVIEQAALEVLGFVPVVKVSEGESSAQSRRGLELRLEDCEVKALFVMRRLNSAIA